jgi:hypothetical protein
MLNRLARTNAGRAHRAPAWAPVHRIDNNQNDSCPSSQRAARPPIELPWRLACHWRPAETGEQLECFWQLELAVETEAPERNVRITAAAAATTGARRRSHTGTGRW